MVSGLVIINGTVLVGSTLTASFYDFTGRLKPYSTVLWYGNDQLPEDPDKWLKASFDGDKLVGTAPKLYITNQTPHFLKCLIDQVPSQLIIVPQHLSESSKAFDDLASSLNIFGKGIDLQDPIDSLSKHAAQATDLNRINQSLYIILTTPKGSVPMLPTLGSDLAATMFKFITPEDLPSIELSIRDDILSQEPRVIIDKLVVEFDDYELILKVRLEYRITNTNIGSNFIYNRRVGESA